MSKQASKNERLWTRKAIYVMTWEQVGDALETLANRIAAIGFEPDALVPIAVGGLVPAAYFHHRYPTADVLPIRVRRTASHALYSDKIPPEITTWFTGGPDAIRDKRILIVDDVNGSGATLRSVRTFVQQAGARSAVACVLASNTRSDDREAYSAFEVDDWVVFPWESRSETSQHRIRVLDLDAGAP